MRLDHCAFDASDLADFEAFVAAQIAGWAEPQQSDLEQYLRAHPGHSVRDWKAKGLDRPAPPFPEDRTGTTLTPPEVRASATANIARELPAAIRQAAARDPDLVWNPLARKYRLRSICNADATLGNSPA